MPQNKTESDGSKKVEQMKRKAIHIGICAGAVVLVLLLIILVVIIVKMSGAE